jgi:hypothetical protein
MRIFEEQTERETLNPDRSGPETVRPDTETRVERSSDGRYHTARRGELE